MKKYLILATTLIATINSIFAITVSISSTNTFYYNYPFNSFDKVENTMSLSKNHKNVIYIMLDMTTGFDVTSILQSNQKMAENLTGFTNFENLITSNWGTNASVPNIFGGYDYDVYHKNHGAIENITFKKYMHNAINVLTSAFGKSKWDISAVANQYYDYNPKKSYWDSNWKTLEHDFKAQNLKAINANDVSRMLDYKYPELYKNLNLPKKIYQTSTNANYLAIASYLSHLKISSTEKNKFMTIMDESNHSPIMMDENGNYQKKDLTIENIYNSTKGFLNKINNFISYLKANQIYDNTMIVIVSDHGNTGTGSLPVANQKYNHSKIDYSEIAKINQKYPGFTRAFPTLLVKPFKNNQPIAYNNEHLYANADALTFIKENNPDVNFELLDNTKDPRYLKKLSDIEKRTMRLPSYRNDSLWSDSFTHYLTPNTAYGGKSFSVIKSIYEAKNYLVSVDSKDYYNVNDKTKWEKLAH